MTAKKNKKKNELERFSAWVSARGGEVLVPTNEWELVRFRGNGETSIIYTSKTGSRTFTGMAAATWEAFQKGDTTFRLAGRSARPSQSSRRRTRSVIVATILKRDGDVCFYCGEPFGDGRPRTKEHLVGRTHGGPDHISNLFLSCEPCNVEAGHLSAPEKIRLRDRKRRGRGSLLLADLRPHVEALAVTDDDPAYKALLERVDGFLHQPRATQEKNQ